MPLPPNIPPELINNCGFETYRPFGSPTVHIGDGIGTIVNARACGRSTGGSELHWDHILYLDPPFDIRDGLSRTVGGQGILYSDGDRVRQFMPFGYVNYVVVAVDYEKDNTTDPGGDSGIIIVYLMRSSIEYS